MEHVSDSDEELDSILEVDQILKDFHNNPQQASHTKIYNLFRKLRKIEEVIDLESEIMLEVFEHAIAPQIPFFSDFSQILDITKVATELKIKNEKLWDALSHYLAVNHSELDIGDNVSLLYLLYRNNPKMQIKINKDYIEGSDLHKERVSRRLTYEKIMSNIRNEINSELSSIDTSTAFSVLNLMQILFLSNTIKLELLEGEQGDEKLILHLNELISGTSSLDSTHDFSDTSIVDDYIHSLNQFTKEFKLMHCLDLLDLVLQYRDTLGSHGDLLKFVVYQTLDNIKDQEYYKGATITYTHISQLLNGIKIFQLEEEELADALKVAEFLLMKAISISDREIEMPEPGSDQLVESGGKLMAGSSSTQVKLQQMQTEALQQLSLILVEYEQLQPPNEKVFALLSFEADYIIKSYINTPLEEIKDHSGKDVKDKVNEIPKDVVSSFLANLWIFR